MIAVLLLTESLCASGSTTCSEVQIRTIHPLQFGQVRGKKNEAGWLFLDTNSELYTSRGISLDRDSCPAPGQVEIIAPGGSRLTLRVALEERSGENASYGKERLRLQRLKVGCPRAKVEELGGELYRLQLPESQTEAPQRLYLNIGGELRLKAGQRPMESQFTLFIECVDIALKD